MEKIVKVVDEKRGVVQVTTPGERWYALSVENPETKLPEWEYVPSVTWICSFYPRGIAFMKWLASTGWDEAQAIKEAAGGRGSKVHQAVNALLDGLTISMDEVLPNPETQQGESLTLEEYEAIQSFAEFYRKYRPVLVVKDMVVWNKVHGYAGTADYLCRILPEFADKAVSAGLWLIDFKTSKAVWPSHEIQVSAYRHTPEIEAVMKVQETKEIRLGILQVGYKRNKDGYKLTEVQDKFRLFLAAREIWAAETDGQSPLQRDFPVSITLEKTVASPDPTTTPEHSVSGNGRETKTKEVSHGGTRRVGA